MTMFLPSHMAELRARFGLAAEVAAGIALYGGFLAFMGFGLAVVTPIALCDAFIEEARKLID